ncbi:hypothetical protein BD324DRAFT_650824 [Kockovaella imperatae]|uniref:Ubiquitin thioesterase OTU n=1 Tax=Kockovaella imperatae TaxID=4999 RepID=A0A1Y1UGQ8_9TREE|nr:hypothetical protein BD324DRAFT_650824 [Kockovaella imperatae]ORX37218.1 hypothetical protein BD324DRAFT_650824 [Kockovaella imperatae]
MVAIRLRHPKGVTTLNLDPDHQTVEDLRAILFSTTEIPPYLQEIKYGYPPKAIPPEVSTLAAIPIGRGDQIIVTALAEPPVQSFSPAAPSVKRQNEAVSAPKADERPRDTQQDNETPAESSHSVRVPGDGGFLQLRVVPDDNSCLFSAVSLVFEGGMEHAQKLRRVVADAIRSDPHTYSDVVLGSSRDTYMKKILEPNTWGGAIGRSYQAVEKTILILRFTELAALSKHYKTEISSYDVQSARCDRFGQDEYDSRCLLVYSGIHYDAVSLSPLPVSPASFHATVFPTSDQNILSAAEQLVTRLQSEHYYTDTAAFDLRCSVCKVGLKGESGAREHARQTGHVEFGEY